MRVAITALVLAIFLAAVPPSSAGDPATGRDASIARHETRRSPVIILGFLGGFVRTDDKLHIEVQLASRLQADYSGLAHSEVFENHRGYQAYAEVLQLLDSDGDGTLSDEEKHNARIILYGHSWGASELVTVAQELQRDSIPVLLTIQVDSIAKRHENDAVIPGNVAEAVNFYQPRSVLHGRPEIRAADPARTMILGNFRFDYKDDPLACSEKSRWLVRHFAKPHAEIECDPAVWNRVESLIRSKLPHLASSVAVIANNQK